MNRRIFVMAVMMALAGCSAGPRPLETVAPDLKVAHGDMPPPSRRDLVEQNRPYLIGPFDRLVINVFGVPDLNDREVQVDSGGQLSYPLAGVVPAAGKTPGELEKVIAGNLRPYIRDPQVTVNLKETVSQVITVDGAVREPGLYPVIGHMSLMRAVATAKGITDAAKLDSVVVFRTVDGQKMAALYNLRAIRNGNYADPEVFANDVVVVGESQARKLFRDFVTIAPFLTTPLVVALQRL